MFDLYKIPVILSNDPRKKVIYISEVDLTEYESMKVSDRYDYVGEPISIPSAQVEQCLHYCREYGSE